MHTFFVATISLFVGLYGPIYLSNLFRYVQNRRILKDLTPQKVDDDKLCKGPHSWINATTFTDKGPGSTQVCQLCGFIPSLHLMVTAEAIDRIEENNRIRAIQDKIFSDFQDQEEKEMKAYFDEELKNGVDFEKLVHIHGAGMTFGTRFNIYRSARAEEIEKAITGSNA